MKRLAIMGVGSLGTIMGAYISKAGRQVDLVDANREHVAALNQNGATIVGNVQMNVPVKALTPDQMEGTYDIVIYMVKQTYNDSAFPQLLPHVGKDTIIVACPNGLPEEIMADYFGREKILGAPVGYGAEYIAPGISKSTTVYSKMFMELGSLTGEVTPAVTEVREIIELMCPVHITTNLLGGRWSKLYLNAAGSGMSTVLGCTFGEIYENDTALNIAVELGKECIEVARANGATMIPMNGMDFDRDLYFTDEEDKKRVIAIWRSDFFKAYSTGTASMLQDINRGAKKTEIDAIDGVVSQLGRKKGVPTPRCDKVIEIVKRMETRELKPGFENLKLF
ncbi:ketopantoate reductase family protein [Papillibacter cinnamivorans]|uniref:2-dehydropantoate 2-reductase n=1 Tax=Papillibacter cinnamivorans DSM 12816 TaxID=1122930 RepID=A0A1W2CBT7_9FIRM|nr:2-dehydropantoate 2-reductase [Papillibacter cinnamivorans]SMC82653.1 2-dehydropantoate 2-reductase [Papillibacter cinnamivorans DSM 12816]